MLFPSYGVSSSTLCICDVLEDGKLLKNKTVLHSVGGDRYLIVRILKRAIYGQIVLGIILEEVIVNTEVFLQLTDRKVAIKVMRRERIEKFQGRYSENPLTELAAVHYVGNENRNVVGQIDCCSDTNNIYLIMRYCSQGSLSDFMHHLDKPMDDDMARDFMKQMLNGLEHLQSIGIAHRDLSSQNILVDEVYNDDYDDDDEDDDDDSDDGESFRPVYRYLISDFGMALRCPPRDMLGEDEKYVDAFSFKHILRSHYKTGKRKYMAPEIFTGSSAAFPDVEYVNPMLCDIWALGITLFYVLTGACYPMEAATVAYPNYNAIACNRLQELIYHFGFDINSDAVDLLQRMLQADPAKRITISEIREHPWMNP